MTKEKIAAIVPAFNEEKNVGRVLSVLCTCPLFDEVILVDDFSADATGDIGRQWGARVIRLTRNMGKANAMLVGLQSTDAPIAVFFDADLVGLRQDHVRALITPVLHQGAAMCEGIRKDRWHGLAKVTARMFPVLFGICGERAIRRFVLEGVPRKFINNMTDGVVMNYYCQVNSLPVVFVDLDGLHIVIKEKKWGLAKGLKARLQMVWEFLKIRILIAFHKNEFKKP